MAAGNNSSMDAPLIERRRHPVFPPVQALILYIIISLVVGVLTYQISQRNDAKVARVAKEATYNRCLAGRDILKKGNQQAEVLRTIVRTIADNRREAARIATTAQQRRDNLRAARSYDELVKKVEKYPVYECKR